MHHVPLIPPHRRAPSCGEQARSRPDGLRRRVHREEPNRCQRRERARLCRAIRNPDARARAREAPRRRPARPGPGPGLRPGAYRAGRESDRRSIPSTTTRESWSTSWPSSRPAAPGEAPRGDVEGSAAPCLSVPPRSLTSPDRPARAVDVGAGVGPRALPSLPHSATPARATLTSGSTPQRAAPVEAVAGVPRCPRGRRGSSPPPMHVDASTPRGDSRDVTRAPRAHLSHRTLSWPGRVRWVGCG